MDPNVNIEEQIDLIRKLRSSIDRGQAVAGSDVIWLCDLVSCLDMFLSTGGELPEKWKKYR